MITQHPIIKEFTHITSTMYNLGWDERNGGNISVLLDSEELTPLNDELRIRRTLPLNFDASYVSNRYFLVTGTGKYFRNMERDPINNLGIIQISEDGYHAHILWGFGDEGRYTSELPSHLLSHIERLRIDKQHKVIMHCHPTNLVAMSFVHELDSNKMTHTLWQMCTECIVVFPEGIEVLPWMLCGTIDIGVATSQKMQSARLVLWAHHGIYASGSNLDETFGLIETAEKAADIYLKIHNSTWLSTISDQQLIELASFFNVQPREGILKKGSHHE
jgi:rhamnulose-1-phosphate aldolase